MSKIKKVQKKKTSKLVSWNIPLSRSNFIYFGIGVVTLIIGFYVMTIKPWDSFYALYISPIILLLGYFIIFPMGILKKKNETNQK
ncbi:MAG: hypothetical protein N3F03_06550 [Ignavibacteria bacterium]|nr:hypothetical protein [Ignavibacteria bacterium]